MNDGFEAVQDAIKRHMEVKKIGLIRYRLKITVQPKSLILDKKMHFFLDGSRSFKKAFGGKDSICVRDFYFA